MIMTLSIKKIYFDQIANGEKKFEYRKNSAYYQNLISKKPTILKLHYWKKKYLFVEIKKITLVKNTFVGTNKSFLSTPEIFKIHLGKILEQK